MAINYGKGKNTSNYNLAGWAGLGWMANLLRLWAAAESNEKLVD